MIVVKWLIIVAFVVESCAVVLDVAVVEVELSFVLSLSVDEERWGCVLDT